MGKTIFQIIVETLQSEQCKYEGKDLLLCKLEYSSSINDAYLTDEEKGVVNKILQSKGIKFKVA